MAQQIPNYDIAKRNHMRKLLQVSSRLSDFIAMDLVPIGTLKSAECIDSLVAEIGNDNELSLEEEALQELKNDRQSLVNLYGAAKKRLNISELYVELGSLLRKYGLFDEEVELLEDAIENCDFNEVNLMKMQDRLSVARQFSEADSENHSSGQIVEKPIITVEMINAVLDQCPYDSILYDIACYTGRDDAEMISIRKKAARLIKDRDYQYAIGSQLWNPTRTNMILNLFDSLEGDNLFIARTILTDLIDANKTHMLLYCKDEALLMLGWIYVYGARRTCADRLHEMGSQYPEAYETMDQENRILCQQEWLSHAADLALEILSEDEAVRERLPERVIVDSDLLHLFLSIHHPRLALRWWHASKLKHPDLIAYVGSWTSDDQIKEKLSVKINSTQVITEMLFGDLSAADLVFGFRKPNDLTLQDRFCVEIMKNHPDRSIREFVRTELLKGKVEIPGVDLTKPL